MRKMIGVLLAVCLLAGASLAEIAPESQSLGLSGVGNARELGGYACADGRAVKPGVFLRTAALANATEEDIWILKDDYHLSTIVDLRMATEVESAPDPEIEGVKYLHLGIIDEEEMAAKRQAISAEVMEGLDLSKKTDQLKLAIRLGIISDQMYVEFLSGEPGKAGYARLFRELLALPEARPDFAPLLEQAEAPYMEPLENKCTMDKDELFDTASEFLSERVGLSEEENRLTLDFDPYLSEFDDYYFYAAFTTVEHNDLTALSFSDSDFISTLHHCKFDFRGIDILRDQPDQLKEYTETHDEIHPSNNFYKARSLVEYDKGANITTDGYAVFLRSQFQVDDTSDDRLYKKLRYENSGIIKITSRGIYGVDLKLTGQIKGVTENIDLLELDELKEPFKNGFEDQSYLNNFTKEVHVDNMLIDYQKVNIYQGENLILKDVDFHADEGEFIYIIGKVGSGKSSLLKTTYCELDIEEEDAEKAEVLGRDLKTLKRKEIPALRKEMGIIFQDFQLLHDRDVYKNLQFVLKATGWKDKEEIDKRIQEVLEAVGMTEKKDSMPHELSGGEQQRIAIARSLLNHPKIIIADEPTGNLDPETASHIIGLMKDISKNGTAVVVSTHNIPMLDLFPGIVYRCKDGTMTDVTREFNQINRNEDGEER